VISGTKFRFYPPDLVTEVCGALKKRLVSASEIAEIRAQCDADEALCLACEDGMVVVELRPQGEDLELFVWLAVAFQQGAFGRQHAALLQIARDIGAQTIAFQTRRRGWARRLGPEWLPRGTTEYVRHVNGRR